MRLAAPAECLAASFGDETCVRILAESGFDAIDWSFFAMTSGNDRWCGDDWRERALRLKELGQAYHIAFSQAHAPFPSSIGEEPFDTLIMQWIHRSMEAAALMGARNIVVHPHQHIPYRQNKARLYAENLAFYRGLIPYCEEFGIRVCIENMWGYDEKRRYIVDSVCSQPEEFCAMLDELDSPWITGCLDIGHCALVGEDPAAFIRALGAKRLQALHVHDVNYLEDNHTLPFLEKLDWESITKALAEIGYEGDFTFEADNFLLSFPPALQPEASILMAKTGRYLIYRIQAQRP